ncbi:hypothetical protein LXL04_018544 [Taraxacum kok-saghyz]
MYTYRLPPLRPPSGHHWPPRGGGSGGVLYEDKCGVEHVGLSVLRLEIYIAVEVSFSLHSTDIEDTCGVEHVGLSVLRLEIYIAVEVHTNGLSGREKGKELGFVIPSKSQGEEGKRMITMPSESSSTSWLPGTEHP